MTSFLCHLLFSCALSAPGARSIDELTFGTALYDYYLQRYDQALVDVMVAEQQGRTGDDPVRFELAKGSFAFEQGMYRFATATFQGVDPGELSDLDRMRLAFHLAREDYRRRDWSAVETQLATIDLGSNWRGRERRHPEVTFMSAEAALARHDFAAAETALGTLPEADDYLAYGLFNLGVAQRQAGDTEAARHAFERLAALTPGDRQAWDLVQRGRLALALMARDGGDPVDARALLGSLPAEGRYRDMALAAYGKLAAAQGDDELAARLWLTVLAQPEWSTSHATAELALPMSLEKLSSTAQALGRYRQAEQVFEQRLAALEDAATQVRDPARVQALLHAFADPDEDDGKRALAGFGDVLGRSTWAEWLSGEDVHQALVEWRELSGMAAWLSALPPRIAAFQEVTAERRRRSAQAKAMLSDRALGDRRDALAARVKDLQAILAALATEPPRADPEWMRRLASDDERHLIDELTALAARADERLPAAERGPFLARIRRLEGVVFWQIADHKAARVRALEKRLDESRRLLAEADTRIERLTAAEARFAAGVETDFLALQDRTDTMTRRVAASLDRRRQVIGQALRRGLDQEMARTRQYLLTARIAIARASDQLASTPAADAEPGS